MNPLVQQKAKAAQIAQLRREANSRFATTLRKIHDQHALAEISDANMARYIELDPERSAQRGLPVVMTKEQWKEIQPRLGQEPVNILFRRSGALQGNVPPLAPRRPGGPSPGERQRANAAARAEAERASAAEASEAAAVATAAEWHKAVSRAASRGSVAASRGSNGSAGSSGVPGPPLPLSIRAPSGPASSAAAAALQAGLGNYNSPRVGDPSGASSSVRAESRLTLNTPAGSFGAPSRGQQVMNVLGSASSAAFRQNSIAAARRLAATRAAERAAAAGPGGKRKTRRSRKTRRQRK